MKIKLLAKWLLSFCIFVFGHQIHAQIFEKGLNIANGTFDIKATQEKGIFNIEIFASDDKQKKVSYSLSPFSKEVFEISLLKHIQPLLKVDSNVLTKVDSNKVKEQSSSLFYRIIASTLTENPDDAPLAGKIYFNESVNVFSWKEILNKKLATDSTYQIKDIEVEFDEGFIAQFKVTGDLVIKGKPKEIAIFDLRYPLGFSSKKNFNLFGDRQLYNSKHKLYIKLNEIIKYYDYSVQYQTRDLSPANQVLRTPPGKEISLYKSVTSKLFEARIYSDFLGIDKTNPNGLVQFEISKRININTNTFGNLYLDRKNHKGFLWESFGLFQYFRPFIRISKLEENNKYLSLSKFNLGNDSLKTPIQFKTSPLNLLYYQNLNIGFDFNLFKIINSNLKYEFEVNGSFAFSKTSAQIDTIKTIATAIDPPTLSINYLTYSPEVAIKFLPEERFNFNLKYRLTNLKKANSSILTESLELIKDGEKPNPNYKTTNWINQFEMEAIAKTAENGRLFARWKFNFQRGNINQNFNQIQVGYSFFILKQNNK